MAYPRSRTFQYFGNARGPAPRSSGRPIDPELDVIMKAVQAGEMTADEGAEAVREMMAKRDNKQEA